MTFRGKRAWEPGDDRDCTGGERGPFAAATPGRVDRRGDRPPWRERRSRCYALARGAPVKEPRAQLPALPLQLRDPPRVLGRGARPDAAVDLGLGHPVAQRLGIDAQLLADPGRRPGAVAGSGEPAPLSGSPAHAARRGTSSVPP